MANAEHMTTPIANPWTDVSRTYHVHLETVQMTLKGIEMGMQPITSIPLEDAREQMLAFNLAVNSAHHFKGSSKEFTIPTSNSDGGIPVSVYIPDSVPQAPPILIYFHGGSLMMGSRRTHERSLQVLAEESKAIVVNVEYRLLPCLEDPLAPFNDAAEITDWVMKNKEAVGGCAGSKIGTGGDSAGGQLACSVSVDIEGLNFQILIYPTVTDLSWTLPSAEEFRDIPGFNTRVLEWRTKMINTPIPDRTNNARVHSLSRTNFGSAPVTLMIIAQLDPLRDYCLQYSQKLKDAGVKVEEVIIDGVPHGFFSLPGIFKTKFPEACSPIAAFLKTFY